MMPCDNKVVESVIANELYVDFVEIHSIMYNDYKFLAANKRIWCANNSINWR